MPLLRAGRARVTSRVSVAANRNAVNWDDLQWERSYNASAPAASRRSPSARSTPSSTGAARPTGGTGNVSHPGAAPTNLLAPRPGIGPPGESRDIRMIRRLPALGIVGTPETACLPALLAAPARPPPGSRAPLDGLTGGAGALSPPTSPRCTRCSSCGTPAGARGRSRAARCRTTLPGAGRLPHHGVQLGHGAAYQSRTCSRSTSASTAATVVAGTARLDVQRCRLRP